MAIAAPQNAEGIGGYDYSFVDTPHDRFICKICYLPSRDPYLSECCGHLICRSCLENAEKATTITNACPTCRNEEFNIFANKAIDREIRELLIYCTNKEKGCKWQGELNDINKHLDSSEGCPFEMIQCEYHSVGCKQGKLARKDLETHNKQRIEEHLRMTKNELTNANNKLDDAMKQINSLLTLMKLQLCPSPIAANSRFVKLNTMAEIFESECPVIIKVSDFNDKKESEIFWLSEPFYSHKNGYKICLFVDAAGSDDGKGTHTSVGLILMKGQHDNELPWPLKLKFQIKLLNQLNNSGHMHIVNYQEVDNRDISFRVTEDNMAPLGCCIPQFVSHLELFNSHHYLKNDCLFFQVTKL